ncbi:MAG: hypothetical protein A2135_00930 [Actinobacteria bacterium RBG_16_67_15]|nr:MAG: hypothetical protein A2135_00930 [Actinobacteria bacterium RBG_16_67_15]
MNLKERTVTTARIRLAAGMLAVLAAFMTTYRVSNAAFSAPTSTPANSFAAGDVALADNDSGAALFNTANMAPGDTATGCIEVTYSGSLDAEVRLYGAVAGGTGLEAYLDLEIERGSGSCAAFGGAIVVWQNSTDGDLGVFLAGHTDFATGVDDWAPVGGGSADMVPYRFTVTLQDDNAAQGESAVVGFTWEAQSS